MDKYNIGTMSFKKDGKIYTLDIDSIKTFILKIKK